MSEDTRADDGAVDDGPDRTGGGDEDKDVDDHLEDLPDGCGCVEMWEHLAEYRDDRN